MSPEQIKELLGDIPWMSLEQGKTTTEFIHRNEINNILELGFQHGVSSCYMASAVNHKEDGSIVTIDLDYSRHLQPNIEQLLHHTKLRHKVTIFYEPRSYLWRLMKLLEVNPKPQFDLCYIDGAHLWETDGFAFFLADRLLRPGGWVIFDDLDWKVAGRPAEETTWASQLTIEERNTAQIRKVYELLVKTHPDYGEFRTELGWAYARKAPRWEFRAQSLKTEVIIKTIPVPFEMIRKHLKRL